MAQKSSACKRPGSLIALLFSGTLAAISGWILYSRFFINHRAQLSEAISARRKIYHSPSSGDIHYYVDDQVAGRPLVLIHSVNAAASAYEMRPLFEAYRSKRPVYALDLPGFGFSERQAKVYMPRFYENVIREFLEQVVKGPADCIALSLSGEFAARAALGQPNLINSLVLISPTGFNRNPDKDSGMRSLFKSYIKSLHGLLSFPLWGRALFDLLTTRASIRYFLQPWFSGAPDEGLVQYSYQTSHQPGAEHAPLYFLSGRLFTYAVSQRVYDKLRIPVLTLYGQDPFLGHDTLEIFARQRANWQLAHIAPSRGMPHFEKLDASLQAIDAFWKRYSE